MSEKAKIMLSCGQEVASDATFDDLWIVLTQINAPNILSEGDYALLLKMMVPLAENLEQWWVIYINSDSGSDPDKAARMALNSQVTIEKSKPADNISVPIYWDGSPILEQALEKLGEAEPGSLEWDVAAREALGATKNKKQYLYVKSLLAL